MSEESLRGVETGINDAVEFDYDTKRKLIISIQRNMASRISKNEVDNNFFAGKAGRW